jgi:hypothetical protein
MYKDLKSWHTGEVRTHELLVSGMDYGYFYSRKFWSWVDVHVSDPKSAKTEEKNRLKGFLGWWRMRRHSVPRKQNGSRKFPSAIFGTISDT